MDTPKLDEMLMLSLNKANPYAPVGHVDQVVGLTIEATGFAPRLGELCTIETGKTGQTDDTGTDKPLLAEVVGFHDKRVLLMPFGDMDRLSPGCRVTPTGEPFKINVGPELLGRVLDGLGNPIDERFPLTQTIRRPLNMPTPHPLKRTRITTPLSVGVRAIDGFTTLGQGQRVGIFSGSGVGKSTTLGMIARNTEADLSVIALIGERGREVRDFIEESLGEAGLRRAVVVVATAEQPALTKIKAALVATSIAEYFRDTGKNVLLMMDSLTRVAMALREVGLSVGEPPTSRGYTPSVFSFMPRLLERAGTSEVGAVTGLYTVLVEADDFNEPVSDMVRGLLDGHILLSRELAEQNHFPAVDVLTSVSRLMVDIVDDEHLSAAGTLKGLLASYRKAEDLINIGAYVQGSNHKIDQAVGFKDRIDAFLRQAIHESSTLAQTTEALKKLALSIHQPSF